MRGQRLCRALVCSTCRCKELTLRMTASPVSLYLISGSPSQVLVSGLQRGLKSCSWIWHGAAQKGISLTHLLSIARPCGLSKIQMAGQFSESMTLSSSKRHSDVAVSIGSPTQVLSVVLLCMHVNAMSVAMSLLWQSCGVDSQLHDLISTVALKLNLPQ